MSTSVEAREKLIEVLGRVSRSGPAFASHDRRVKDQVAAILKAFPQLATPAETGLERALARAEARSQTPAVLKPIRDEIAKALALSFYGKGHIYDASVTEVVEARWREWREQADAVVPFLATPATAATGDADSWASKAMKVVRLLLHKEPSADQEHIENAALQAACVALFEARRIECMAARPSPSAPVDQAAVRAAIDALEPFAAANRRLRHYGGEPGSDAVLYASFGLGTLYELCDGIEGKPLRVSTLERAEVAIDALRALPRQPDPESAS